MAKVIKTVPIYIKTNRGKLFFNVYYIDTPVVVGNTISVRYMSNGSPWYGLANPISVIMARTSSSNYVLTEFESNNGALKTWIQDSPREYKFRIKYNEIGYDATLNLTPSVSNCLTIAFIFIGSNGVPFIWQTYVSTWNYTSSDVQYINNTSTSFGTLAIPNRELWINSMSVSQSAIDAAISILYGSSLEITDPYDEAGTSGPGGGTGTFDGTGDDIDIPALPTLSATNTGFITLFNPTIAELQNLANYMWVNPLFDLSQWRKIFADPMDAILGLSIVPVDVPSAGMVSVTVGNISTGIGMTLASSQYVAVDCGTLNVNEFWGAYLDYDPYTKAEIYLPYCGTHPLAVDDIMGKAVHVVYHVDILSGACCAYVKCGGSVLYSFIGECASSIPISGADWTQVINGVLSISASVGSMIATGGASAPMAVSSIASTAVNSMKPSIERSGSMSGTGGMLGVQTPYLILTRPRQALPAQQNRFMGYPSFITETLSNLSGYTEVEEIHLENIPATGAELSEIENILKSGVIL